MKGKTITTVVASVIIFIAIIFVLIAVGGEEGEWVLALVLIGILIGILAILLNVGGKWKKSEEESAPSQVEQDEKLNTLKRLRTTGVLTEEEYQSKVVARNAEILDEKWNNGEFFDTLTGILTARESEIISQPEFINKCNNLIDGNDRIATDQKIIKLNQLLKDNIISEKEYNHDIIRRYLFLLSYDMKTISVIMNGETPIFTLPMIKYLSYYKYLTNLDRGNMEEYYQKYKDGTLTMEQYVKKMKKMMDTLKIFRENIRNGSY